MAAFQWASKEGVLAEENMRGITFEVRARAAPAVAARPAPRPARAPGGPSAPLNTEHPDPCLGRL